MPNAGVLPNADGEPNVGVVVPGFTGVVEANAGPDPPDPKAETGEPNALVVTGLGFANGEVLGTFAEAPNAPNPSAGLMKDGEEVRFPKAPVVVAGELALNADGEGVAGGVD